MGTQKKCLMVILLILLTTNRVPFLTDNMVQIYHDKGLSNIAPAILNYLGLPVPSEMTNDILFEIKNI